GGELEEAVGGEVHLVVPHVLLELVEPEGQAVGDEVHAVAAARELLAQLGRHRPRAAHRRIAGDADPHRWITWWPRAQGSMRARTSSTTAGPWRASRLTTPSPRSWKEPPGIKASRVRRRRSARERSRFLSARVAFS